MKTPKEVLFARHRAAEKKLDAVREQTVAAVCARRTSGQSPTAVTDRRYNAVAFWREVFSFRPQGWAALGAVWIAIFAFRFSTPDQPRFAETKSSALPPVIAEVRQQKRLFAELIGETSSDEPKPVKAFTPRPRSEFQSKPRIS